MIRSHVSRILAFAAAACLAVSHVVHAGVAYVYNLYADLALFLRSPDPHGSHHAIGQSKALVSAKAFSERLAQRKRPTVTTRWRMCPSG